MKVLCDTHCHTVVSQHAFSTVDEMIVYAQKRGLELICITDHGPKLPDAPNNWYFRSLPLIPRGVHGVKVLRGIESNVLDQEGNVDIEPDFQEFLDIAIASMHIPVYKSGTREQNTQTWLRVLDNPQIDILGHLGDPRYDFEFEPVLQKVKEKNRMIEINNSSFFVRKGSGPRCVEILKICKKLGVKIVVSSDSHICYKVGEFSKALEALKEVEFPEELVMNLNAQKLLNHLKEYKTIKNL